MRWKLLRRRLSISAPKMIVRSYLPWPLRWIVIALMLGFSAALTLWAFEFGKEISGLDTNSQADVSRLHAQIQSLQRELDLAISAANTAESRWKTDQASYESLVSQLKASQAEVMALKADLGFYERLMPTQANHRGVTIRGSRFEQQDAGLLRFQLLLMQSTKGMRDFEGRYDITLTGSLHGQPWKWSAEMADSRFVLQQYLRLEGVLEIPPAVTVKSAVVTVFDAQGVTRATHTAKL